eukprot:3209294-Pyramimonas_sp.AAC.2
MAVVNTPSDAGVNCGADPSSPPSHTHHTHIQQRPQIREDSYKPNALHWGRPVHASSPGCLQVLATRRECLRSRLDVDVSDASEVEHKN